MTTTTPSRPPSSFYNQHFQSGLVLKRVVQLLSLVKDLAENVDRALKTAWKTLPPLPGFITPEQREHDIMCLDEIQ